MSSVWIGMVRNPARGTVSLKRDERVREAGRRKGLKAFKGVIWILESATGS